MSTKKLQATLDAITAMTSAATAVGNHSVPDEVLTALVTIGAYVESCAKTGLYTQKIVEAAKLLEGR